MIADPHKMGNPDAFDDLADLFLGDHGTVHAHDAAVGAEPMPRAAHRDPKRERPPITPAERAPSAPRLTLVSDRPVSDQRPTPAPRETHQEAPCVEALILGHLPVSASAWASQYVRHTADRIQGPVALVRVNPDGVRMELHFPGGCRPELRVGSDLRTALANIHANARRVILISSSTRELEAVESAGVSRVTLLTSGDEAGIVAAYGLIKSICFKLRDTRGLDPAGAMQVAVMGAPPARAELVASRLCDAAKAFLGVQLRAEICISRVSAGYPGQALFDGRLDASIADLVAMVALGPVHASGVTASARLPATEPERSPRAEAPAPSSPRRVEHIELFAPAEPGAVSEPSELPAPAPSGELCGFVEGLQLLAARCPYAEEVELAIDDDGRLHALCRAEHFSERGRALERLAIASEWARVHRRVLELTLGDTAKPITGEAPLTHLFTDQPASWRHLLDSSIRIHALAPVCATRNPQWACVPVN